MDQLHKVAGALSAHFRCILMDLPNFSKTGPIVYREGLHAVQGRTAVALLDALGIVLACWVGNSQGGQSAMVAAIAYPERVAKFVCPGCGEGRAWLLRGKAFTYECAGCGRQTSETAGTIMHAGKLPLTTFGRPGSSRGDRAYPQIRFVALARSFACSSATSSVLPSRLTSRQSRYQAPFAVRTAIGVTTASCKSLSGFHLSRVRACEMPDLPATLSVAGGSSNH